MPDAGHSSQSRNSDLNTGRHRRNRNTRILNTRRSSKIGKAITCNRTTNSSSSSSTHSNSNRRSGSHRDTRKKATQPQDCP